jgi:hypothetical protein
MPSVTIIPLSLELGGGVPRASPARCDSMLRLGRLASSDNAETEAVQKLMIKICNIIFLILFSSFFLFLILRKNPFGVGFLNSKIHKLSTNQMHSLAASLRFLVHKTNFSDDASFKPQNFKASLVLPRRFS